jgi:hypothetical protein
MKQERKRSRQVLSMQAMVYTTNTAVTTFFVIKIIVFTHFLLFTAITVVKNIACIVSR